MGILTAGAAYCMMDPAYPTSRIAACMSIAQPAAWLTIGLAPPMPDDLMAFLETLPLVVNLIVDQPSHEFLSGVSTDVPEVDVGPDSIGLTSSLFFLIITPLAVITFTSGSTGVPKGVQGRHAPLTHYYPWMAEEFGLSDGDRCRTCHTPRV